LRDKKQPTNLNPGNGDTATSQLDNQNNAPKRYAHCVIGRRLREPSSPSPTNRKSTKTANDTLTNYQQQPSLQKDANQTNSRDMDTDFSGLNDKRPLYYQQPCSQSPDNTRQNTRIRTSKNQFKQLNTHSEHVLSSQTSLMEGPPSHTQTVTQTHGSNL